jgi:hypothetical protein
MTQQNQLGTVLGTFLDTEMMPSIVLIYRKNIETTPYVNALAKRQTMDLCNSLTVLDIRQATLYLTP